MPFHDNEEVQKIVQSHISKVRSLEESESKVLIRRYKEIRQDLRDRLDIMPQGTFSAQRLGSVLVQIDAALEAMEGGLLQDMKKSGNKAAILGSEHLVREVTKFNKIFSGAAQEINIDTVLVSSDTTNFLFNRYESSLNAYTASLRANLARKISDFAIQKMSFSDVVQNLGQFFVGEQWKLMRIARAELHSVYNLSRQNTLFKVSEDDRNLQKTLFHPQDSRTGEDSKQVDRLDLIVDVDKPFKYTFKRTLSDGTIREDKRIFMTPPDRPNDRSIMVPYKKEWD